VPIAATVEGNPLMTAAITLLYMSTESRSAASLNCAHDTPLPPTERFSVLLAVVRTSLTKDVCHLKPGGVHHSAQK
jgi:hypothetical protein